MIACIGAQMTWPEKLATCASLALDLWAITRPVPAEAWASGAGMSQIADKALKAAQRRGETTSLSAIEGRRLDGRDVAQAALAGDRVAKRIANICGRKLGEALAVLIDILNPECIVIGGLAMRLGDLILRPASASLRKEALKDSLKACRIVPAALGETYWRRRGTLYRDGCGLARRRPAEGDAEHEQL